jgi:hypothetical protein
VVHPHLLNSDNYGDHTAGVFTANIRYVYPSAIFLWKFLDAETGISKLASQLSSRNEQGPSAAVHIVDYITRSDVSQYLRGKSKWLILNFYTQAEEVVRLTFRSASSITVDAGLLALLTRLRREEHGLHSGSDSESHKRKRQLRANPRQVVTTTPLLHQGPCGARPLESLVPHMQTWHAAVPASSRHTRVRPQLAWQPAGLSTVQLLLQQPYRFVYGAVFFVTKAGEGLPPSGVPVGIVYLQDTQHAVYYRKVTVSRHDWAAVRFGVLPKFLRKGICSDSSDTVYDVFRAEERLGYTTVPPTS